MQSSFTFRSPSASSVLKSREPIPNQSTPSVKLSSIYSWQLKQSIEGYQPFDLSSVHFNFEDALWSTYEPTAGSNPFLV